MCTAIGTLTYGTYCFDTHDITQDITADTLATVVLQLATPGTPPDVVGSFVDILNVGAANILNVGAIAADGSIVYQYAVVGETPLVGRYLSHQYDAPAQPPALIHFCTRSIWCTCPSSCTCANLSRANQVLPLQVQPRWVVVCRLPPILL